MRSTRRTPCTRNGWIGYAPDPCIPPRFLFMNPSASTVRATLHARGMPHTCYGMQRWPFRPSHSRCTVHRLRVGHMHTLAIWVAFGSVAGDSIRRDLPSALLLAPLRACQVHRFPPGGPRASRMLPHCCHFPLPQTTMVNSQNRHYSPVNVC